MLPVPYSSILFWCGMGPSRGPALGSLGSGALTPKHRALKQNRHSAPEPQRGLCIVPAIFWTIITNKNRNHIKIYMRISFKMNRTNKKKVPHKIETAFNFTKDIDLKLLVTKKIKSEVRAQKYSRTVKFGNIFKKLILPFRFWNSRVTPQLVYNITHKTFVLHRYIYKYNSVSKVYSILV